MKRLECLDGLRGVLAVYVMLGHMAPFGDLPGWVVRPLSHGGAAVDVFFILSGMVIMRSLEQCRFQARPFLMARVTRIFPVYLVMLAAGIALQPLHPALPWIAPDSQAHGIWAFGWPVFWPVEIAAHLTMTHGLFPNAVLPDVWVSFLGAAWSLSTEWQFYVLVLLLGRRGLDARQLTLCFLGLAAAGLAWSWLAPEAWQFSRAFLPVKAHYFALGIAGAALDRRYFAVLAAVLCLCATQGQAGKLLPPVVWTLCLAAQVYRSPLAAPLRWPAVQWLGVISYPIYLANEPVQKALGWVLAWVAAGDAHVFTVLWLPLGVAVPIAAAAWLHRYVETAFRPSRRAPPPAIDIPPAPRARPHTNRNDPPSDRNVPAPGAASPPA